MTPRSEALGDGTRRGEEALSLSWRFEPLHPALSLAGGLMGVFRALVQIPMLAMLHSRQELALGCPIALQLIRDHHARDIPQAFEQLAEEFLGRRFIATPSHENVQDMAILIDRSLQIMTLTLDCEKDLIQMPLIPGRRPAVAQLIGLRLAKLPAPLADRFIGHDDPTSEQELFHVAVAETKAEVQPDAMADDFRWKSVLLVGGGIG